MTILYKIEDQYDILLEKLGMSNMASAKVNNIKAPMPGLILNVLVEEGATIKQRRPSTYFGSNENGKHTKIARRGYY